MPHRFRYQIVIYFGVVLVLQDGGGCAILTASAQSRAEFMKGLEMNTKALNIDSYDIKLRQDTLTETWSWCLHLTSGISFAGASSSYDKAIQSIQDYAKKVA